MPFTDCAVSYLLIGFLGCGGLLPPCYQVVKLPSPWHTDVPRGFRHVLSRINNGSIGLYNPRMDFPTGCTRLTCHTRPLQVLKSEPGSCPRVF